MFAADCSEHEMKLHGIKLHEIKRHDHYKSVIFKLAISHRVWVVVVLIIFYVSFVSYMIFRVIPLR